MSSVYWGVNSGEEKGNNSWRRHYWIISRYLSSDNDMVENLKYYKIINL